MSKSAEMVKNFSISKEYLEVISILKTVPNSSRFICEAIIEKYNNQSILNDLKSEGKCGAYSNIVINQLQQFIDSQIINATNNLQQNYINVSQDTLFALVSKLVNSLQKYTTISIHLPNDVKLTIECNN
ncbi:hypothetical protein [Clostridium sp. JS66]|uniref:hypothetical protein n=1 Tax=Clostridium sp. JS66 TaxID=3064705 RepID=UPI00298DDCF5|nr:hypothetical protein [Clostridium sp. JS66]WPC42378.1 hypothetical protein Q6H37_02635 [Clostridium sp. JS66]